MPELKRRKRDTKGENARKSPQQRTKISPVNVNLVESPQQSNDVFIAKEQLIERAKKKRLALLQEMDVLWAAEQYRLQYETANAKEDTRGAVTALNSLLDRLKIFERLSAEQIKLKADKWTLTNTRQMQLDLAQHAIQSGDLGLAARMIEQLSKHAPETSELIEYESELNQLLSS